MKHCIGQTTITILATVLAFVPYAVSAQAPSGILVIEGGTLIDGNGGTPIGNAVIVIEDERIADVATAGEASYPEDVQIIDASGLYVLPGLWDSQVSYNWYYGEVMLNYGMSGTLERSRSRTAMPYRREYFAARGRLPACPDSIVFLMVERAWRRY